MISINKHERVVILYEKQDKKCPYCLMPFFTDGQIILNFNIDHIIPTSRGGKDSIENMVLSCQSCNSAKGNMTSEEFASVATLLKEKKIEKKDLSDYIKYIALKSKFES